MKKYNNNNLLHLKKKLGDIFIFDVMLIKLTQLIYYKIKVNQHYF